LSLARELKAQSPDCKIIYIGHKGDDFASLNIGTHDFDFMAFINAGKFRRYHTSSRLAQLFDLKTWALNIRDLFRLPASIHSSVRLMDKFKPDVMFSKGGFVSVPVGIAAKYKGVPIVTHDSDIVPGLANRIVGRWAKVHATGMPAKHYKYPVDTIEYVGIPVNERIVKVTPKIQDQAKAKLKLPENSQVLLLSGGGNGSVRLNKLLVSISKPLLESNLALHIVHITGNSHLQTVKDSYRSILQTAQYNQVTAIGFTSDFYSYVAAADLIITRAGATTLAELGVAAKACIVIPSPYLTGGHQLKNASELEKKGAAKVVDEDIASEKFLQIVRQLLSDDSERFELAKNIFGATHSNAAAKLAQLILKTAEQASQ